MIISTLEREVKRLLSRERWDHTRGVVGAALQLAVCHLPHVDTGQVKTAALLHDCARDLSLCALLKKAGDFGIVLTSSDLLCPQTLHGPVGAQMAKHEFGICDGDVLRTIALHTTGGPRMSFLAKIVFVADYIEPGRSFAGIERLRDVAMRDLDRAVLACMKNTISYLLEQGGYIHRRMIIARNYLLALQAREKRGKIDDGYGSSPATSP